MVKEARADQRDLHLLEVLEELKFVDEDMLRDSGYYQSAIEKQ